MVTVYRNSKKRRRFQDRTGDRLSSRGRALWFRPELTSCRWDQMGPQTHHRAGKLPPHCQPPSRVRPSLPGPAGSRTDHDRMAVGAAGATRAVHSRCRVFCPLSEKEPSGQTCAPWKQSERLPSSPAGSPGGPVGGERGRLPGPTPASPKLVQSRMWTLGLEYRPSDSAYGNRGTVWLETPCHPGHW